ncbi:MAG: hypothetical protein AAB116_20290 [Candidatus Poribacteria bacterium]
MEGVAQDKKVEIRYSRNSDFTDIVAEEYLNNLPHPNKIRGKIRHRDLSKFVNPYVG